MADHDVLVTTDLAQRLHDGPAGITGCRKDFENDQSGILKMDDVSERSSGVDGICA